MSNYQKVNPSSGGIFGFPLYHLSGAMSPLARAEARKISFPYLAHSPASRGYLIGLMKNLCCFSQQESQGWVAARTDQLWLKFHRGRRSILQLQVVSTIFSLSRCLHVELIGLFLQLDGFVIAMVSSLSNTSWKSSWWGGTGSTWNQGSAG